MNHFSTQNRLVDSVLICVFLLALFVPLITWVIQPDVFFSEVEKRELQSFPNLGEHKNITGFTHAFDQYFQDHFGMREWFISRYQRELNMRFGVSGVSDVHEGTEGWLFYTDDKLFDDFEGRLRFSPKEEQLFWDTLEQKKAWLQELDIAYMFMIAPNKQSIYPEYVSLPSKSLGKSSRLDNLLTSIPEQDREVLLDVRSRLREEKAQARLYNKSDTHWNSMGAHVAYQSIMDRVQIVFPTFKAREDFHFFPQWKDGVGGDLAVMLGRQRSTVEARPVVDGRDFTTVRRYLSPQLAEFLVLPQLKPFYSVKKHGQLRVLVLHDSFFNILKPFICESFGEVLYVTQYYDLLTRSFLDRDNLTALLEIYQPDLVIEQLVERNLPDFISTEYED